MSERQFAEAKGRLGDWGQDMQGIFNDWYNEKVAAGHDPESETMTTFKKKLGEFTTLSKEVTKEAKCHMVIAESKRLGREFMKTHILPEEQS